MSTQLIRHLKPEEKEVIRKREELAAIRTALADRELDLADLRSQLAAFEGRYLRQVGTLYAELDAWKARTAELQARLNPSAASNKQAEEARDQARQTFEEAHGKASEAHDFTPSPELKSLFREVAKCIHPDLSKDSGDHERRTRFMAEANRAYGVGDTDTLLRILDEYEDGADTIEGEGIGAELIRIIRQISLATDRVAAIERELAALRQSDIATLKERAQECEKTGRDLLAEMATAIREQIEQARQRHEALARRESDAT
jgi:hypothetical protein